MPILSLGYLAVENGQICPDILALFFSDLFLYGGGGAGFGVIQHIKIDAMPVPLCLGQYAVFSLAPCLDTYPMLRQAAEHISAFADVNKLIANADTVNAGMLILLCQPPAFQHGINTILIS